MPLSWRKEGRKEKNESLFLGFLLSASHDTEWKGKEGAEEAFGPGA